MTPTAIAHRSDDGEVPNLMSLVLRGKLVCTKCGRPVGSGTTTSLTQLLDDVPTHIRERHTPQPSPSQLRAKYGLPDQPQRELPSRMPRRFH